MALWLLDYLEDGGRGDLEAKLALDVYGYAAPTAGNEAFAAYLESRLAVDRRYACDLDIVPQAWEESTFSKLPSLYEPEMDMDAVFRPFYDLGVSLSRGKGYAQPGARIDVPSKVVPTRGNSYILEAAYQHSIPYLDMLLPERKAIILREVIDPLTSFAPIMGFRKADLQELYGTGP
jgi:hypothetical protein